MFYGFVRKTIDENGWVELKNLEIHATPRVLRDISRYFSKMADLMESGGFDRCSHYHIQHVINDWNKRFPNCDISVSPPEGTPRDPIPVYEE